MKRNRGLLFGLLFLAVFLTLSFSACIFNGVSNQAIRFMDGQNLIKEAENVSPDDFDHEKEGYKFLGWYLDAELTQKYSAGDVVEQLYGKWEALTFTVKFVDEKGVAILVNGEETQTVKYGESAVAPEVLSTVDKQFSGWNAAFDNVKGNLIIQAVYKNLSLLKLIDAKGEVVLSEYILNGGKILTRLNNETEKFESTIPVGFTFDGWCLDKNLTTDFVCDGNYVLNEDLVLYAKTSLADVNLLSLSATETEYAYQPTKSVTLTADFLDCSEGGVSYTYKWFANDAANKLENEAAKSLTLTGLEVGAHKYIVEVTAKCDGYAQVSKRAETTVTIQKNTRKDISANSTDNTFVYDKKAHGLNIAGLKSQDSVSFKQSADSQYVDELTFVDAGEYVVGFKVQNPNYFDFCGQATIKISKANLNVKAGDISVKYGDALPDFFAEYDGFAHGDDASSLSAAIVFVCEAEDTKTVGNFEISIRQATDKNYNLHITNGQLKVEKAPLIITADNKQITYGEAKPQLSAKYDGFVFGEGESVVTGLNVGCVYEAGDDVGEYVITVVGTAANYDVTLKNGTLFVGQKNLTLKADNKNITYGSASPSFSASGEGFVSGDDMTAISGLSFFTNYVVKNNVGGYQIKITAATSKNYNLTFADGALTVEKKALTIRADNKNITYGSAAPSFSASGEGFVSGDDMTAISDLAFSTTYVVKNDVGDYNIKITNAAAANYNLTFADGALTVEKKALTIKADNKNITYGSASPSFSASSEGFVLGDDMTAISGLSFSTNYQAGYAAGNYNIKITSATAKNYNLTYLDGVLAVGKKTLTISLSKVDVAKETVFSVSVAGLTISGLLAGDAINGELKTTSGEGGEYVAKGALSADFMWDDLTIAQGLNDRLQSYDVVYDLQVNLVINDFFYTVNGANATYDGKGHSISVSAEYPAATIEYSVDGVLFGSVNPQYKNVGSYKVYYQITDNDGVLTSVNGFAVVVISAATLTVSVDNKTTYYGSAAPANSYKISGFASGDNSGVLGGTIVYNCDYTAGNPAKNYEITASGLTAQNYVFSYVSGTLDVQKLTITLFANNATVTYGDNVPTFAASSEGFVFGDTMAVVKNLSFETDYAVGSGVGDYYIKITSATADNYAFIFEDGVLTVGKKTITLSACDMQITYGETASGFAATSDEFVGSDDVFDLQNVSFATTYLAGNGVGQYAVSINSGVGGSNYDVVCEDGALTVLPCQVAVVWVGADNAYYYNGLDQGGAVSAYYTSVIDGGHIAATVAVSGKTSVFKNAGDYRFTASTADTNYTLTNTTVSVVMQKGNYSGIVYPQALTGVYDSELTLSYYALADGFSWANGGEIPTCGTTAYRGLYNLDESNYNSLSLNIPLELQKATAYIKTLDTLFQFDFDGSEHIVNVALYYKNYNGVEKSLSSITPLYSNGNAFTAAGTYLTVVSVNAANYKMTPTSCYVKVKGVKIGSTLYTVEDALNASASGNTVVVANNTAFANFVGVENVYNGSGYYTVKSGVTLLVPYDAAYSTTTNEVVETNSVIGLEYVKLTIPSGVTLTVNGTLTVNAKRGIYGQYQGIVSGNYGVLQLDAGSNIKANSGAVINSNGFITGNGVIDAYSGAKVYDVLAIKDWYGGKISNSIKDDLFVFNQYTLQNIEARTKIYSGASLYGRYYIVTSVAKPNDAMIIVGSGAVLQVNSGYMSKYYNPTNGRTYLDLYGTMTTNTATLTVGGTLSAVTVSTANTEFPLPGNFSLTIYGGSTGELNNRFKFLPGSELIIKSGATVNVASDGRLFAYGYGASFVEFKVTTSSASTRTYTSDHANAYSRIRTTSYALTDNAKVVVDGTLNVYGVFGGVALNEANTGVINVSGTVNGSLKNGMTVTKDGLISSTYTTSDLVIKGRLYLSGDTSTLADMSSGVYKANGDETWTKQ